MPFNFSWVIEGRLAGMGYPGRDTWEELAQLGVGAVVSLTVSPPPGRPEAAGLQALHVPVHDFGTPDEAALASALAWMDARIQEGRPVVVHCRAGIGRTGTLLAAFLVHKGATAEEAVVHVRRMRPGSLETPGQVALVERYAREAASGPAAEES